MPSVNQPVTTTLATAVSPTLLDDAVESRIVKIRPAATPLDQITRCIGARHTDSMKVSFYSVDIKPGFDSVPASTGETSATESGLISIPVTDENLFAPTDTVMLPAVSCNDSKGRKFTLAGYVVSTSPGAINIRPNSMPVNEDGEPVCPALESGAKIVRMGRAASELDVMTGLYNSLPVKDFNYCQIFK